MEESPSSVGIQQERTESSDPENTRTKKVSLSPILVVVSYIGIRDSSTGVSFACIWNACMSLQALASMAPVLSGETALWKSFHVSTGEIFSFLPGLRPPLLQLGCPAKRKHMPKKDSGFRARLPK